MLFSRPTFFLGRFLIKGLIRILRIDSIFMRVFTALFASTSSLIFSVGLVPTFRVLWALRSYIRSATPLTNLRVALTGFTNLNSHAITTASC